MAVIIDLTEAKAINPDITTEDLEAFELIVRGLTNNKFQDRTRRSGIKFIDSDTFEAARSSEFYGFRTGDRIEISGSEYNDGLYTIQLITENQITVDKPDAFVIPPGRIYRGTVTRIFYPADVKRGIKNLIRYDFTAANRIGIKSRSVARMSETYQDTNAGENAEGYPAAMLSFLQKHKRMRWE